MTVNAQPNRANAAKNPFVELNGELVTVQGAVTSLQDQIDALVRRVDTVEERITANEEAIVTLNENNDVLASLIATNATDIFSIQGAIADLESQTLLLQQQLAAATGDISSLETQIAANQALISDLQSALIQVESGVISLETDLQVQIDQNLALITALQNEIALVEENIATAQKIISGSCPEGQAIREVRPDGSVVCEIDDVSVVSSVSVTQIRVYVTRLVQKGAFSGHLLAMCPVGTILTGGGIAHASTDSGTEVSRPASYLLAQNSSTATFDPYFDWYWRAWEGALDQPNRATNFNISAICLQFN